MLDRDGLTHALAATVEAMGQTATPAALILMADDLSGYSEQEIAKALKTTRKKGGRFQIATVLDVIESNDGRPSQDKAWAMIPKDESASEVITEEIAKAWGVAYEMYYSGDHTGAQIAFKREYQLVVAEARESEEKVHWFPSFGDYRPGRDEAVIAAAGDGRLMLDHAKRLVLPASIPALARAVGDDQLLLESQVKPKQIPHEAEKELKNTEIGRSFLAQMKSTLKGERK